MDAELSATSNGVTRRSLLRRGLTVLGIASIAPVLSACEVPFLSSSGEPFEMPIETPEEAIIRLLEGNARFVRGKSTAINESAGRRVKVADRQRPFATIFSCVDSRVPPELVFDRGLGDLFVIRTAGNVVDSAVMGSLEYGAYELEIPLLLVLGHNRCGAVKATMETIESGGKAEGSIAYLVEAIRPAVEKETAEELAMIDGEGGVTRLSKEAVTVGDAIVPDALAGESVGGEKARVVPTVAADPLTGDVAESTAPADAGTAETPSSEEADPETTADADASGEAVPAEETVGGEGGQAEEAVVAEETVVAQETDALEAGGEADPLTIAIRRNVALTMARIMKSPIIAERVRKDRLRVVGAFYDLETGIVELTDNVPKQFLPAGTEDTVA